MPWRGYNFEDAILISEKVLKDVPSQGGESQGDNVQVTRQQYDCPLRGKGRFRVDFLIYHYLGLDLTGMPNAMVETLRLPTRVVLNDPWSRRR